MRERLLRKLSALAIATKIGREGYGRIGHRAMLEAPSPQHHTQLCVVRLASPRDGDRHVDRPRSWSAPSSRGRSARSCYAWPACCASPRASSELRCPMESDHSRRVRRPPRHRAMARRPVAFAFRHHAYRSTLAHRIFLQALPNWMDPPATGACAPSTTTAGSGLGVGTATADSHLRRSGGTRSIPGQHV